MHLDTREIRRALKRSRHPFGWVSNPFPRISRTREAANSLAGAAVGAGVIGAVCAGVQATLAGYWGAVLGGAVGGTLGTLLGMRIARFVTVLQEMRTVVEEPDTASRMDVSVNLRGRPLALEGGWQHSQELVDQVGQRVEWIRQQLGMSLEEVSRLSGLSSSAILNLERGKSTTVALSETAALASALGVTTTFLLTDIPPLDPDSNPCLLDGLTWMIGRRLVSYLDTLSPGQREELTYSTVQERFSLVVDFLCTAYPSLFTPGVIAVQLGLRRQALEQIAAGNEPSDFALKRLVSLTGIPMGFFSFGEVRESGGTDSISTAEALEYLSSISEAVKREIPAPQLIEVIKSMDQRQ